jgi:hypothetical protein
VGRSGREQLAVARGEAGARQGRGRGEPGASHEQPGVGRSSQEQPGTARNSRVHPGNKQEHLGNKQEQPGVGKGQLAETKSSQEQLRVGRSIRETSRSS